MSAQRKAPERSCDTDPAADSAGTSLVISGTRRMRAGILLSLVALCGTPLLQAADPQSYKVDIASTGDSTRDDTLKATSDLINLRKTAPVGPFALIGRARGDLDR